MKHYELFYLVSAQLPETQLEPLQNEVSDWIEKLGATITKHEQWGRKKLAYPIDHEKFGFYILAEFNSEPNALAELQKKLNLHKSILRSLILEKKPMTAKELLMQEVARERAQARASAGHDTKSTRPHGPSGDDSDRKDGTGAKKDSKISLEDLDKKLDELLDTNMIR